MTREEAIKEILAVVCDIPLGEIKLNSTHITPRCAEDVAELGMYLIKLAIKMKENE